jgi:hypothetical protein
MPLGAAVPALSRPAAPSHVGSPAVFVELLHAMSPHLTPALKRG